MVIMRVQAVGQRTWDRNVPTLIEYCEWIRFVVGFAGEVQVKTEFGCCRADVSYYGQVASREGSSVMVVLMDRFALWPLVGC